MSCLHTRTLVGKIFAVCCECWAISYRLLMRPSVTNSLSQTAHRIIFFFYFIGDFLQVLAIEQKPIENVHMAVQSHGGKKILVGGGKNF